MIAESYTQWFTNMKNWRADYEEGKPDKNDRVLRFVKLLSFCKCERCKYCKFIVKLQLSFTLTITSLSCIPRGTVTGVRSNRIHTVFISCACVVLLHTLVTICKNMTNANTSDVDNWMEVAKMKDLIYPLDPNVIMHYRFSLRLTWVWGVVGQFLLLWYFKFNHLYNVCRPQCIQWGSDKCRILQC